MQWTKSQRSHKRFMGLELESQAPHILQVLTRITAIGALIASMGSSLHNISKKYI